MINKDGLDLIIFGILLILIILNTIWNVKFTDTHEEKYFYRGIITGIVGIILTIIWLFI